MRIHELRAVEGATKAPKRKGRGTGSGKGTTAGSGHDYIFFARCHSMKVSSTKITQNNENRKDFYTLFEKVF